MKTQELTLDQSRTPYCLSKDKNRRPLFSKFFYHFSLVQTSHDLSNNSKQHFRVDPPLFFPSYTIWSNNIWDFWAQSSHLQSLLVVSSSIFFCFCFVFNTMPFLILVFLFCFLFFFFLVFLIQIIFKNSI